LPDSGHLQEEQAQFANRHGFSKNFRTVSFARDLFWFVGLPRLPESS
jgi:hypothetical protein